MLHAQSSFGSWLVISRLMGDWLGGSQSWVDAVVGADLSSLLGEIDRDDLTLRCQEMVEMWTTKRGVREYWGNDPQKLEFKSISYPSQFTILNVISMTPNPAGKNNNARYDKPNQAGRTSEFPHHPIFSNIIPMFILPLSNLFLTLPSPENTKLKYPSISLHLTITSLHQVQYPARIDYLWLPAYLQCRMSYLLVHHVISNYSHSPDDEFSNKYSVSSQCISPRIDYLQINQLQVSLQFRTIIVLHLWCYR